MRWKPADELFGRKCHRFLLALIAVVLVSEADLAGFDVQQAIVRNRDPVGIATDVIQHLFGSSERRFGIYHPFRLSHRSQVTGELAVIPEILQSGEELQLAGVESILEMLQKEAAEQARQHAYGQKEPGLAGDPASAIG